MYAVGKWTVQQAAELSVPAPTIEAALDGRFLSGLKEQRVAAAKFFNSLGATEPKQQPVSHHITCFQAHCMAVHVGMLTVPAAVAAAKPACPDLS